MFKLKQNIAESFQNNKHSRTLKLQNFSKRSPYLLGQVIAEESFSDQIRVI